MGNGQSNSADQVLPNLFQKRKCLNDHCHLLQSRDLRFQILNFAGL